MKKVFIMLNFRTGEYEHTDSYVAEMPKDDNPTTWAEDNLIRDMFLDVEEQDDGFYFDSGCICVNVLQTKDITEQEYKVLSKFL